VKAYVLANLARLLAVLAERYDEAIEVAGEALVMAKKLERTELTAHALNTVGLARVMTGDPAGIDELEESLRLALEHGSPFEIGRVTNNLAVCYWLVGRIEEAAAAAATRLEMAERFRLPTGGERTMVALFAFSCGRWREATRRVDELLASGEAPVVLEPDLRQVKAQLLLARDDREGAASECERALALLSSQQQDSGARTALRMLLLVRADIALAEGRRPAAQEAMDSALSVTSPLDPDLAIMLALQLHDLGRPGDSVIEEASSRLADPWLQVAAAIVQGQLEQAADRLVVLATPPYEAAVRLRLAVRLIGEGRRDEADRQLQGALTFYRSVGATRYIREGEALLVAIV